MRSKLSVSRILMSAFSFFASPAGILFQVLPLQGIVDPDDEACISLLLSQILGDGA